MRNGHYEIEFTAWAHGHYNPDKPWKVVFATKPGSLSGEPSNGRRYMSSYAERDQAIQVAANSNARMTARYKRAVEKANVVLDEERAKEITRLEAATPVSDGRRPPA